MMNKTAFVLLLGVISSSAIAQDNVPLTSGNGYTQDSNGNIPRSDFGLCWRSGDWTPADALPGCDGALKPPVPNPIAPEVKNNLEAAEPVVRCDFSVTLPSDATFAFGLATPNAKARQYLATEVAPRLATCQTVESVTVTGHTDRIGNARANQALSEKRAAHIAALLQKETDRNIAMTITGVGSNESRSHCSRQTSKAKLISCLAPDRRVEITVRGSSKPNN